jgi:hypothetical protein
MWSRADVFGLFSNNVVSFSRNVVLRGASFSLNLVLKPRMLSVPADYVLGSLQLVNLVPICFPLIGGDRNECLGSSLRSLSRWRIVRDDE